MKKWVCFAFVSVTLVFLLTAPSQATLTSFTDRTSYEAALTSSSLIDFEATSLPRARGYKLHHRKCYLLRSQRPVFKRAGPFGKFRLALHDCGRRELRPAHDQPCPWLPCPGHGNRLDFHVRQLYQLRAYGRCGGACFRRPRYRTGNAVQRSLHDVLRLDFGHQSNSLPSIVLRGGQVRVHRQRHLWQRQLGSPSRRPSAVRSWPRGPCSDKEKVQEVNCIFR